MQFNNTIGRNNAIMMYFTSLFPLRFKFEPWWAALISSLWLWEQIRPGRLFFRLHQNSALSILNILYAFCLHILSALCKMSSCEFTSISSIHIAHKLYSAVHPTTTFENYCQLLLIKLWQYVHHLGRNVSTGKMYCHTTSAITWSFCHHWLIRHIFGYPIQENRRPCGKSTDLVFHKQDFMSLFYSESFQTFLNAEKW